MTDATSRSNTTDAFSDGTEPVVVGRLMAVSVGLPHDVSWQGRVVRTAVFKSPAAGPHTVRTLNIDGDGQGDLDGHGGPHRAVLVYQQQSYTHWRQQLRRDDLAFGQFGENFTVDGLADDTVCIGDRFEVGTAVFEVSQPRVTCYRVGLRLDEPQLPALLVAHGRPGFYLRVLREGVVEAGNDIVMVGAAPDRMSVADIDALLYRPGHDRAEVARAAVMPALSPGWRASFDAILASPEGRVGNPGLAAVDADPPPWSGFRQLRVARVVRESDTVLSVHLVAPDAVPLPRPRPGQFITLSLQSSGTGRAVIRNYSLSGAPEAGEYRVSVKLESHGLASGIVHRELNPGALIDVAAPRGRFVLDDGDEPVLLVSAGIGATPVLAMLHALAAMHSRRDVWWVHGARNGAEHPFAGEVAALLQPLPYAHRIVAYTAPLASDERGTDYMSAGRVNADLLASLQLPVDAHAYICGPTAFTSDVTRALTELGLNPGKIRSEAFGAGPALTPGIAAAPVRAPHVPDGPAGTGGQIVFSRSGLSAAWREDFASLLDFAEACAVPVRWSCRSGVCHNCESAMLAGSVVYDPVPIDQPAPGNVLLCCAKPDSELVLDL